MSDQFHCPKCGTECWRESADVGVGVIYGPWGCPQCGWSDAEEFDISDGPKTTEHGGRIDQFGGVTPP